MGDMIKVRLIDDKDLPESLGLVKGEVYEMEILDNEFYFWRDCHSLLKDRFEVVTELTISDKKTEAAREILDLQEKIGPLNGDDYWKALYRIKELAGILAKLTLNQE